MLEWIRKHDFRKAGVCSAAVGVEIIYRLSAGNKVYYQYHPHLSQEKAF